jgi:ribosomal protein S18 acetylase RimI-like enzyme
MLVVSSTTSLSRSRAVKKGIAESLVQEAIDWLRAHGAPRVVLWTAEQNAAAQHLFSRIGFRRTMIEMTLELTKDDNHVISDSGP